MASSQMIDGDDSMELAEAALNKLVGMRRVKQICTLVIPPHTIYMHALCWDGTIWEIKGGDNKEWKQIREIPV